MKEFIQVLWILIIGLFMGFTFENMHHESTLTQTKAQILCEYSKFATSDAQIINGVVYCRSTDNAIQALHKPAEVIEK